SGNVSIKVVMPDGAPSLSMAKLLAEKPQFEGYDVSYEIVNGVDPLNAAILNGTADIALLPTILAAKHYNSGIDIKIVGANVFGVLYLIGKTDIADMQALKGKLVGNLGPGGTPDFMFKYLAGAGNFQVSDTRIEGKIALKYAAEANTLIGYVASGAIDYALLGEPQVSAALSKNSEFKVVMDLQEEWGGSYPQVSTIVKTDTLSNHSAFVTSFLSKVSESADWVADNPESAQTALTAAGSSLKNISAAVIDRSNIDFIPVGEIKDDINAFLQMHLNFAAASVGGKLPGDGIYNI
ncbi:MAG: ABC transporter substrate-binding protein, partial [Clostridia bacterium]|nr:ABC transporter substrate-binding protein [Clostridia bacterium]